MNSSHIHCTTESHAVSYLVLGFTQLVLQFREAEASHGDEVTDHSHELIPTLPRPALLVVQLLAGGVDTQEMNWLSYEIPTLGEEGGRQRQRR